MELEGIVADVANFGAFVDIGVHQDRLVHISQLATDLLMIHIRSRWDRLLKFGC